jgi:hypothetical protein
MQRMRLLALPLTGLMSLALMPPAGANPVVGQAGVVAASAPAEVPSQVSAADTAVLRVATYNVRTARATQDKRSWLQRAPDVAREILVRRPAVVMLQELGPGRADGKKGTLKGRVRQTTSLTNTLSNLGGGQYKLVRTTSYFPTGTKHGTQGARILYDSSRVRLLSRCPDMTGKRSYNRACAFDVPLAPGDSLKLRRSAAFAQFADRRTGHRFWVASAHLDSRHSGNDKKEAVYNRLRAAQAAAVVKRVARHNSSGLPVIFGGDINSWRTDRGRYAPHRALVARGYVDTANAPRRVNYAYASVNHFKTTMKRSSSGNGVRLDVVMVKGGRGILAYENKMRRVDPARPSDHNMGIADIRL